MVGSPESSWSGFCPAAARRGSKRSSGQWPQASARFYWGRVASKLAEAGNLKAWQEKVPQVLELAETVHEDPIKRLEILAALQERRPDTRSVDSQYVGSLRTLRDIVEYVTAGEGALEPAHALLAELDQARFIGPVAAAVDRARLGPGHGGHGTDPPGQALPLAFEIRDVLVRDLHAGGAEAMILLLGDEEECGRVTRVSVWDFVGVAQGDAVPADDGAVLALVGFQAKAAVRVGDGRGDRASCILGWVGGELHRDVFGGLVVDEHNAFRLGDSRRGFPAAGQRQKQESQQTGVSRVSHAATSGGSGQVGDDLAAGLGAQLLQRDKRQGVREKADRAIPKAEVGPAGVAAAEGVEPLVLLRKADRRADGNPVVDRHA